MPIATLGDAAAVDEDKGLGPAAARMTSEDRCGTRSPRAAAGGSVTVGVDGTASLCVASAIEVSRAKDASCVEVTATLRSGATTRPVGREVPVVEAEFPVAEETA